MDNQPKSPFYDTKYEHGIRVMNAVYESVDSQVNEIKKDFEKAKGNAGGFWTKFKNWASKIRILNGKPMKKAVDALQKI